jgi:hypothetical protein
VRRHDQGGGQHEPERRDCEQQTESFHGGGCQDSASPAVLTAGEAPSRLGLAPTAWPARSPRVRCRGCRRRS